eukprot:1161727-Pelagomonas_calceolata.AAC.8
MACRLSEELHSGETRRSVQGWCKKECNKGWGHDGNGGYLRSCRADWHKGLCGGCPCSKFQGHLSGITVHDTTSAAMLPSCDLVSLFAVQLSGTTILHTPPAAMLPSWDLMLLLLRSYQAPPSFTLHLLPCFLPGIWRHFALQMQQSMVLRDSSLVATCCCKCNSCAVQQKCHVLELMQRSNCATCLSSCSAATVPHVRANAAQ